MVTPVPRRKVRREKAWDGRGFIVLTLFHHNFASPHIPELRAQDDLLNEVAIGAVAFDHFIEERLIGELNAASEGVAEQFAAELPEEILAPFTRKIVTQTLQSAIGVPSRKTVWEAPRGTDRSRRNPRGQSRRGRYDCGIPRNSHRGCGVQ